MTGAPLQPALLVIDLSQGFTDRDSPLACDSDGAVAVTAELLAAARENGVPVVFTTVAYEPSDFATAAVFMDKVPGLRALRVGHPWTEIDPRIHPRAGEPVLRKLFASAFFGTELAAILDEKGVDALVITGASTSGCVRATAVDAIQHQLRALVVREGVADRDRPAHDQALADVEAKYGSVISSLQALRVLAESPPRI